MFIEVGRRLRLGYSRCQLQCSKCATELVSGCVSSGCSKVLDRAAAASALDAHSVRRYKSAGCVRLRARRPLGLSCVGFPPLRLGTSAWKAKTADAEHAHVSANMWGTSTARGSTSDVFPASSAGKYSSVDPHDGRLGSPALPLWSFRHTFPPSRQETTTWESSTAVAMRLHRC